MPTSVLRFILGPAIGAAVPTGLESNTSSQRPVGKSVVGKALHPHGETFAIPLLTAVDTKLNSVAKLGPGAGAGASASAGAV